LKFEPDVRAKVARGPSYQHADTLFHRHRFAAPTVSAAENRPSAAMLTWMGRLGTWRSSRRAGALWVMAKAIQAGQPRCAGGLFGSAVSCAFALTLSHRSSNGALLFCGRPSLGGPFCSGPSGPYLNFEDRHEAHFPAQPPCSRPPSRLPRPHGDRRRPQGASCAPRSRPFEAFGLSLPASRLDAARPVPPSEFPCLRGFGWRHGPPPYGAAAIRRRTRLTIACSGDPCHLRRAPFVIESRRPYLRPQ
jgi:hypothetical protein